MAGNTVVHSHNYGNNKFLNEAGVRKLVEELLRLMEQMDTDAVNRIIQDINANSSETGKIPSAKATYDFVLDRIAALANLRFSPVQALPTEGETNVIYLVPGDDPSREDEYIMYIWSASENGWHEIGNTYFELAHYWNDTNLIPLTETEVVNIVADVVNS